MEGVAFSTLLTIFTLALGAAAASPLVRFNIWLYRQLHLDRFAYFWERQFHWWVPVVRLTCIAGAAIVLVDYLM